MTASISPIPNWKPRGLKATTALTPPKLIVPAAIQARFAAPAKPALVPSPQQADFFAWVATGTGNCVLEAVAGAGKTTTLIQALRLMSGSVFFGAYNKKIADEIKLKAAAAKADRQGIYISTMHGAGYSACRRAWPKVEVDDRKVLKLIDLLAGEPDVPELKGYTTFIAKMVSFGKQFLIGMPGKASFDNEAVWLKLMDHFSVDQDLPNNVDPRSLLPYVITVSKRSYDSCATAIDFDDMIYGPLAHNLRLYQNDWVLIDECQDINPARRELAKRLLRPTGRAIFVGDSNQAIYGFCHPAGIKVKTPTGCTLIEDLQANDPVIVSHTDGQVQGWQKPNEVLATHKFHHSGFLLTLHVGKRSVEVTPQHKVPVMLDPDAQYYTYIMRRAGCFRVGRIKAYTTGMFMLTARAGIGAECSDAAWILAAHPSKGAAIAAEDRLLLRMKGTTFTNKTDEEVAKLPTDEIEALKILGEHGRMVDFPLWTPTSRHRFARNGRVVIEACNVIEGMRAAFYSDEQIGENRGKQNFAWTPIRISARPYSGQVYGITVRPAYPIQGYTNYPLYFANDILVHNTGAGGDAIELIISEFNCKRLPLTVTYRCPKAVVQHAHQWVSHIQAHESAPDGVVRASIYTTDPAKCARCHPLGVTPSPGMVWVAQKRRMETCPQCSGSGREPIKPWFIQDAPLETDAVLCRYTRPLIQSAYKMIREGVACKVEGRDIGNGLIAICRLWRLTSIAKLEERLAAYLVREIEKAQAAGSERREQEITDKVETLRVFIERCKQRGKRTINQLVEEIKSLFADNVTGMITLSTVHKSKGREWPRVYWIQCMQRRPCAKQWEERQETNLKYVACTRAMAELILVPEGQV